MAQHETYTNTFFNPDFIKGMMPASNGLFPFDFSALMETQRKNMQTMSELQQIAVGNLQSIAQRQSEIISQMVESNTNMAQQIMTEGTPEEKIALQADMVRTAYENSVTGLTELSDLVAKSGKETGDIISKRVTASLTEFKSSVEKTKPSKASKAA